MILSNKRFIKGMALFLVVALMIGNFVFEKKNLKAATINENEVANDDNYKEFIKKFRKDGVDITITSLDKLYNEFNSYDSIDDSVREEILAKTSDEVIIQFLLEEEKEFYKISQEENNYDIFLESLEEDVMEKNKEYLKDVDSEYYKKGEDSYKKITVFTNKYGGECEITIIDEAEELTKGIGKYTKLADYNDYEESYYKDYGERKFSYSVKCAFAKLEGTFGYTLSYGHIDTRYIKGEVVNYVSPACKCELDSNTITTSESNNIGEKVSGELIFLCTLVPVASGGYEACHYKIKMSVEQGADSNHPTKCGMRHILRAQTYELIF